MRDRERAREDALLELGLQARVIARGCCGAACCPRRCWALECRLELLVERRVDGERLLEIVVGLVELGVESVELARELLDLGLRRVLVLSKRDLVLALEGREAVVEGDGLLGRRLGPRAELAHLRLELGAVRLGLVGALLVARELLYAVPRG